MVGVKGIDTDRRPTTFRKIKTRRRINISGKRDRITHNGNIRHAAPLNTINELIVNRSSSIMMNLDLVITSDTSVAHLAGGLGVLVWVALPYVPDWRWLLERSDSPWYPTMRLFRQKSPGDWRGVFEEIEAALRDQLRS
jgi:hypothetical protein